VIKTSWVAPFCISDLSAEGGEVLLIFDGWQRLSGRTGDGVFLLFVIGISSFIRHSDFLIRHSFVGWGFDPRVLLTP